ncbi:acVLRF1 family peptidyl-tRNA hydrolase [Ornithinimicrobium pekingense]|uniref:Actinobacteria/chloroflexi VLRF1 release factor domain-containing protein n=1 Tax=Ornithinimicrobium pekingense TaxID=384677 RepID=A0ABQ2FAC2_9MICO|nr:acVLRF1 family peptidyl-tRNA hydrolase [Ornithinimicrobium pekingense]GGK74836.1 hypothetical protein GCM10011509_24350 [Ornithinimicrobium pekingense]
MTAVRVAPERLDGWVRRFAASHGEVARSTDRATSPSSCLLTAADGSWARLTSWTDAPVDDPPGAAWEPGEWARPPALLVVLVRRGGYAAAVVSPDGSLLAHKVGTRHVQSRTAAGGWSQQRFARRRANQADVLVDAVAGHAARVLAEGEAAGGQVGGLVLGGDRRLTAAALEELATGALGRLHRIPRRDLPDLPDPRRAVLDDAVGRARAVLVEVVNA